jgi:Uncharacterized protein conserved in bacteria (DUF2320).
MTFARLFLVGCFAAALPARAVYAPLPEQDIEKDFTATVRGGVYHDSNIFGAETGAISSTVYSLQPKLAYNGSLTDQTFAAAAYTATIDHFVDRPGEKTLDSHDFMARIAHAFSPTSNIDISDYYQIAKNPESLLAGLPVNTDQSFKRNEFNARFVASPLPKLGATLKFRGVFYDYDNPVLSAAIDRIENLFGVSGSYDLLPELKAVVEYRRENINYRRGGATKDKDSDFLIGGFDYAVARKLTLTGRLGNQWRERAAERSSSGAYAEFSGKYNYAPRSFVTGGYVYTLEETSNVALFSDTRVSRFFVNVQHALSALMVASASYTYEPSELQGRRGVADADETTRRAGLALTWLPTPHWSFSVNFDYDDISSEVPGRDQNRERYGVSAAYQF